MAQCCLLLSSLICCCLISRAALLSLFLTGHCVVLCGVAVGCFQDCTVVGKYSFIFGTVQCIDLSSLQHQSNFSVSALGMFFLYFRILL